MAGGVPALHPERRGQLNRSPKVNWVEKRGGLPPYINSVATALERQGMTRSVAIATAVNTIKKACATGLWGGQKRKVSGAIQSAACAAAAQWEALKVSASIPDDERLAVELARRWDQGVSPGQAVVELAGEGTDFRIEFAWDESKYKRVESGKAGGGRFTTKNSVGKNTASFTPTQRQKTRVALQAAGRRFAKPRKVAPSKTADHVAAGLHRVGRTGNTYVDRAGKLWHRVGEGPNSHFAPGLAKGEQLPRRRGRSAAGMGAAAR